MYYVPNGYFNQYYGPNYYDGRQSGHWAYPYGSQQVNGFHAFRYPNGNGMIPLADYGPNDMLPFR